MGAKVPPTMYADLVAVALRDGVDQSDIIREGLSLALEARGKPQDKPIDGPEKKALRSGITYKQPKLQEAARLHPENVRFAVRAWSRADLRHIIQETVRAEKSQAPGFGHLVGPPILRPLHATFGSYAAFRDALVAETGVQA